MGVVHPQPVIVCTVHDFTLGGGSRPSQLCYARCTVSRRGGSPPPSQPPKNKAAKFPHQGGGVYVTLYDIQTTKKPTPRGCRIRHSLGENAAFLYSVFAPTQAYQAPIPLICSCTFVSVRAPGFLLARLRGRGITRRFKEMLVHHEQTKQTWAC